jgi:hypothetical protein
MKPSTYLLHRIGAGIFIAIYLPFAVDVIFNLGYFGRTGKGIAVLMLGLGLVYLYGFSPTRIDMEEHRERKWRAKSVD